ncbi:MAG: metal-dependent transcriptional regulator [Actinobacteria bacterium]|nr:metal-dependent transcriptional regulator [Actinomycetota bacterium]
MAAPGSARGHRAGEYHPAFEEYCEAIFELQEDSLSVIQARIAERLEISRPAVSEMIRRMATEGLITVDDTIQLTESGQHLAEAVVRRHRLAERMLTDVLGLSWSLAHEEAGKWEHVISAEVEERLVELLGNPSTCPHGNPIPGSNYRPPETIELSKLPKGTSFTVRRIPEELEFSEGMLDFLEKHSLRPGRSGVVLNNGLGGDQVVEMDGQAVAVGAFASERILVSIGS